MAILRFICRDALLLLLIISVSAFSSYLVPEISYRIFREVQYSTFVMPIFSIGVFFFIMVFYSISRKSKKITRDNINNALHLKKISLKSFLVSSGVFFLALVLTILFNVLFGKIVNAKFFPSVEILDGIRRPNNIIKALILVGLVFGGIFEELFWRGILLNQQIKKYGKNAWVLNGILWSISHIVVYNPIKIIFIALSFSFISAKYKTTTITVIFHALINGFIALRMISMYS